MTTDSRLANLANQFRQAAGGLPQFHVVAGFDGFIDEIISVVDARQGLGQWSPVKDIETFGRIIQAAAGRSSLREIIVHRADPGGCSVNLGDGLMAFGLALDCFATLGQPRHEAFEAFAAQCHRCQSWGQYGRTLAFEFADGKVMFSAVTQLAEFNCRLLEKVLQDGVFSQACAQAQLIAITDWSLYPHMTDCWRKLQAEVFHKLPHRPYFLLDLVDPSSRIESDIMAMLDATQGFEMAGPTVLGLNGTEANVVARALGLPVVKEDLAAVKDQAAALRQKLGLSQVVIHCLKLAAQAGGSGGFGVMGPFCANPKKSTGAGDRFNAGYACGLLLGLAPESCLWLGCAASGYFVRQAKSATAVELADFIDRWAADALE